MSLDYDSLLKNWSLNELGYIGDFVSQMWMTNYEINHGMWIWYKWYQSRDWMWNKNLTGNFV